MPTCPAWVPAAFFDGVYRTALSTLAWTLSFHSAPWSAPNATVPELLRAPPLPPLPVVGPAPVGRPVVGKGPGVVGLAVGLLRFTTIAVTAIPPPHRTTMMTA